MTKEATQEDNKVEVKADREKYVSTRSASGAKSLHNGDLVAVSCAGATAEQMFTLAKKFCGEDFKPKYEHLNIGMQRMNLGNRLRGQIAKINKANAALVAKATEAEPVDESKLVSGEQQFQDAVAPLVERMVKARLKEEERKQKEAEAKAAEKAKKKAAKAAKDEKAA